MPTWTQLPAAKNPEARKEAVFQEKKHNDLHYPWWFGGSASCFAVTLTHPLDLSTATLLLPMTVA